jgi:hypothetical protein
MKLSNQAVGCLMVALQEAIMEQKDIVPILKDFDFIPDGEDTECELVVSNPPKTLKAPMKELV